MYWDFLINYHYEYLFGREVCEGCAKDAKEDKINTPKFEGWNKLILLFHSSFPFFLLSRPSRNLSVLGVQISLLFTLY